MDLELRQARLQAELDALRERSVSEIDAANERLLTLEEKLAAQATAILVLTRAAAVLPAKSQTMVPEALMVWASELRRHKDERGALAAESLAHALLRTVAMGPQAGEFDGASTP